MVREGIPVIRDIHGLAVFHGIRAFPDFRASRVVRKFRDRDLVPIIPDPVRARDRA